MSLALRRVGMLVAAVVAAGVGWRIVATHLSDRLARTDPQAALSWDAGNPDAALATAHARLAAGDPRAAAATARSLLHDAPLRGDAFAVLAQAAAAQGDAQAARPLFALALRRAPSDLRARAWVIDDDLRTRQYSAAVANLDILLRIAPAQRETVLPALLPLLARPAFAHALVATLATDPDWAPAFFDALLKSNSPAAIETVFGALAKRNALADTQTDAWIQYLMAHGNWGEAYARWAGTLQLPPGVALAPLYDGGFQYPATGAGFGWQLDGVPGVVIERVNSEGTRSGHAARVTFLGRRVDDSGFAQNLLLAPGAYRLEFRARAESLQSDRGLVWAIGCQGVQTPVAESEPMLDSFAWRAYTLDFRIPANGCTAQRLWLYNPGAAGPGKLVSGVLIVGDFSIAPRKPARSD